MKFIVVIVVCLFASVISRENDNVVDRFGRTKRDLVDLEFWLIWNGATLNKLESSIFNTSEGCGVLSRDSFSRKDRIGLIPRHLLITTSLARKKSFTAMAVHSYMVNKRKVDSWRAVLAVFLLEERSNPRSFWKPYIRSLPRTLHHLPMFWGNQTRSWLQGSPFLKSVDENRKEIHKEWDHILHAVPALREEYNFEEYLWAASIVRGVRACANSHRIENPSKKTNTLITPHAQTTQVQSRSFAIATERDHKRCGGSAEKALVPLADLLNHRKHGTFTVSWGFNQKLDGFELKAFRDIEIGDALTDSYGESKSADQFVRMYGFTPSAEEDFSGDDDDVENEKMPVLLTRNVNMSHLFVLDAVRRLYREEMRRRDVYSFSRFEQKSFSSCDDDDDVAAYVKKSTTTYETTLTETSRIYDTGKGTSSFRMRAKIRPKDRTPTYLEDARFLSYLRGVSQAYVDGFEKSVEEDGGVEEDHEKLALQAADFMLKHPHRAAKNGLNVSLDAEYLAVRSVFISYSLSLSLSKLPTHQHRYEYL